MLRTAVVATVLLLLAAPAAAQFGSVGGDGGFSAPPTGTFAPSGSTDSTPSTGDTFAPNGSDFPVSGDEFTVDFGDDETGASSNGMATLRGVIVGDLIPGDDTAAAYPESELLPTRYGIVDYVNINPAAVGFTIDPVDYYRIEPQVFAPQSPFGLPRLTTFDIIQRVVGPSDAGGAILGIYPGGTLGRTALGDPPAIAFLKTDTSQNGYTRRCQQAVEAVLPFRPNQFEPCRDRGHAGHAQCRAAISDYVSSCLTFPAADAGAPRDPDAPPVLQAGLLDLMGGVTGVLYRNARDPSEREIHCTAVRVSREWLLTARHCGFRRTADDHWILRDIGEMRFVAFDDPLKQIPIIGVRDPIGANPMKLDLGDASGDYLFLKIEAASDQSWYPAIAKPQLWDKIVVYSFALPALIDRQEGRTEEELVTSGDWIQFMAYDASRTCLIAAMPPPNCLAYPCQSESGSSGAPIFRVEGDVVELVGVHLGFIEGSASPCESAELLGIVNRGVTPRARDLVAVN